VYISTATRLATRVTSSRCVLSVKSARIGTCLTAVATLGWRICLIIRELYSTPSSLRFGVSVLPLSETLELISSFKI